MVLPGPLFGDRSQQRDERRALISEDPDVTFWLGQRHCPSQGGKRRRHVPLRLVGERLQQNDLDDASRPPAFFRREQQALQEPGRLMHGALWALVLMPRQEQPGQGDVLELAQVTEAVINGQAVLTRPAEGFTESALPDPDPCLQRRDRPQVREEVAHITALRLV